MKGKLLGFVLAAVFVATISTVDVKAVDYETALVLQQQATDNYYAMLGQQQAAAQAPAVNPAIFDTQAAAAQAAQDALAAQQKAAQDAQNAVLAQAQAAQDALLAQQKAAQDAVLAQQKAAQDALAAQQKAAMEAMDAQQQAALQAQQSALEATTAIQAASLTCPQVDVVCDTNCAEQNALLYAKTLPDFVLVDISEQRAIFYKNGLRVLGDNCVTGNKSQGHDTTVGIHKIIFKDLNRTLHGSYGEAFVRYWMRFTNSGQGLHDAGWRNKFGQTIYVTNGSHGCVNLTRNTAATIYNNSYLGMPVIVEN